MQLVLLYYHWHRGICTIGAIFNYVAVCVWCVCVCGVCVVCVCVCVCVWCVCGVCVCVWCVCVCDGTYR